MIRGGHGIRINSHGGQPNPRNSHLCTKNRPKTKAIVRDCTCTFFQFPPQHAVAAVIYSLQDLGELFLTNITKPIYKV